MAAAPARRAGAAALGWAGPRDLGQAQGRAGVRAWRAGRLWATRPAEAGRKERGKENLFFL